MLFFSASVLSVGTVPAPFLQNALIMPCEEPWLKGLCCVSLCPFVSPDCVRVHPSFNFNSWLAPRTCALTGVGPLADASPPLSPIETGRHNGAKRRERNVSGTGRKGGTDRDRARGWRRSTR